MEFVQFRCIKYRYTNSEKNVRDLVTSAQRDVELHLEEKKILFYSESNLAHLRRGVKALNAGLGMEHELIEDDDEEDSE